MDRYKENQTHISELVCAYGAHNREMAYCGYEIVTRTRCHLGKFYVAYMQLYLFIFNLQCCTLFFRPQNARVKNLHGTIIRTKNAMAL